MEGEAGRGQALGVAALQEVTFPWDAPGSGALARVSLELNGLGLR